MRDVLMVALLGGMLLFGLAALDRKDRGVMLAVIAVMALLGVYLGIHGYDPMLGQGE